jgi:putative hydroxymethylpyrimidine transport system permease protein
MVIKPAGAQDALAEDDVSPAAEARSGRGAGFRNLAKRYAGAVSLVLILLVVWQAVIEIFHIASYLIPAPTAILSALQDWQVLGSATWVTVQEVIYGFSIALVAGVLIAIVLHLSPLLRRAIYPLLIGSQTVPIIVIGPILVVILGYNIYPKLIIVALICFFPIVVNTIDGLGSVSEDYILMMRTLDASRAAIFRRVEFPACRPMMFTGLRIAVTYAAIGAVVGEWAGSTNGLGYVMLEAEPNLQIARIFAIIVILTGISVILFILVSILERLLIPWASTAKSGKETI